MALIDTINKMKQRGMQDSEIARSLQEQGYSPEEITSSFSQSNINPAYPQEEQENGYSLEEMQPSLMSQQPMQPAPPYPSQQAEMPYPQPSFQQQPALSQETYPSYQEAGYEQYAPEQYYPSTSDTMAELAEEIVDEKLKKIQKEIGNISEFKTDTLSRIRSLNDRIKRIENIIDNLNHAIIKKISIYGENLEDIKSELTATQESFSKIINPLVDKARATKKPAETKKAKKAGMEHYLRR